MMKVCLPIVLCAMLSACVTAPTIVTREVAVPCIKDELPAKPEYKAKNLPKAKTDEERAEYVYSLYNDWIAADAYAGSLKAKVTPCTKIGDGNSESRNTK